MANKEFQVRHGLIVNNTVLVANTITNNVGIGTANPSSTLQVIGNANITSNLVVQGIDVNQAISSGNAYAASVGASANSYATSVGTSGNAYALTTATDIGTAGNAYATQVGTSANSFSNTKLSNSTGTFAGTLTITGDLITQGNVTLGDASTDTITLNGSTISLGNNQNFDGGTLFIDATNNRVGIGGNTNPGYALTVNGSIGFSGTDIVRTTGDSLNIVVNGRNVVSIGGSGIQTIRSAAGAGLNIINTDSGATRMFVSDNVGIGTTQANTNFQVMGSGIFTTSVVISGDGRAPGTGVNTTRLTSSALEFNASPAGATGPFAIRINGSTSSPANGGTLTIQGQNVINTTVTNKGGSIVLRSGSGNTTAGHGNIQFLIADARAVHIDENTRVGIGTSTPSANLNVIGTGNITSNLIVQGIDVNQFVGTAFTKANDATTIAIAAYNNANSKFSSSGGTITGNVDIVGNLTLSGNTFIIDATRLEVDDPLIYLAANNYTSDIVDIGFIANYVNATGANVHTGLYREHEDKMYYLFQGYDKEPANNHIGALSNNMTLAVLNADLRTSNLLLFGANAQQFIISAFDTANAAPGIANSYATSVGTSGNSYATSVGTSANAYSAAIVAPAFDLANTANAVAVYAADFANTINVIAVNAYNQANTGGGDISPAFNQANLALATAQSAFNQANTGGGGGGADVTARTTANLSLSTAQSAFGVANTGNNFLGLADTPSSYSGNASSLVAVNSLETGLAFVNQIEISDFTLNAMIAPISVANDAMEIYVTATGTSPNREVALKLKNETGDEITISTVLV